MTIRSIGVDVSFRHGHHVYVLETNEPFRHVSTAQVQSLVRERLPAVVAVDAPQALSLGLMKDPDYRSRLSPPVRDGKYLNFRVCEYELARRGLSLYLTPVAHPPSWMQAGFEVFSALGTLGLRLPREDSDRSATLLETYPAAVFSILAGHIPARKTTVQGIDERRHLLRAAGLRPGAEDHHTLDAMAAALAARLYAEGRAHLAGDPQEGFIAIPGPLADGYSKPGVT